MSVPYKVGAVGVYDKSSEGSRDRPTALRPQEGGLLSSTNAKQNGNDQRHIKYDTDVFASKEDAKVALVIALRNAGKDETSHPNAFHAASLVNKIGTSNGMTKTQTVAACRALLE